MKWHPIINIGRNSAFFQLLWLDAPWGHCILHSWGLVWRYHQKGLMWPKFSYKKGWKG